MHSPVFRFALSALAAASLGALLAGCGGSSSSDPAPVAQPAAITGVVADGPLQGARVCYDLNDNAVCDASDVMAAALTDANGRYSLSVPADVAGKHAVVAEVPATAVDKDTGQAIGAALVFRSPATALAGDQQVFVSVLSTAVAELGAAQALSLADAQARVKSSLGLTASPLADFTAAGGDPAAALSAKALTGLAVDAVKLAAAAQADAGQTSALLRNVLTAQLDVLADALAGSSAASAAGKASDAVAAAKAAMNLDAATVKAVADALKPAAPAATDPAGPFVSVRRFAYTDANNHSYTLFVGDNSQTDSAGEYASNEVRRTLSAGADQPFNRNQAYWTGNDTGWQVCALQWQVVTRVKQTTLADGRIAQSSRYCGASLNTSTVQVEDIGGKSVRDLVSRIRAYPLADSVGNHTDAKGLPVKWGPDPALVPADAVFPAGARYSVRQTLGDQGGTDRIELANKSSVRWPDGRFRQATTLEQYSGMPGNLQDPAVVPANANTVFVFDLPLEDQPDATLEAVKRWRAGFDVAALKIRFYECDLRKSDQAAINCSAQGDGTLAITQQGDARVMKVASGFPAEITMRLAQQRFWAERSGTVFRGVRDLPRTRYDQRLNAAGWDALRGVLGIAAHAAPAAPVAAGPFETLRRLTYTDAGNYFQRVFKGDTSAVDSAGYYTADELLDSKSGGVTQPQARNRLYWTGTTWLDCPLGAGGQAIRANSKAPFDSLFCGGYADERVSNTPLTLAGRRMSDVVNDIRAYGSKDLGFDHGGWGPNPTAHPQLANTFFPAGATMEYRGNLRKATPLGIVTTPADQIRVAPAPHSTQPSGTWPFATGLDEFIAKHPGDLAGDRLDGSVAFWAWGYDLPAAPAPEYTTRVEIRVAFDANGQKARFYQNNRSASTGFTTNYVKLLDTSYSIETVGGVRLLRFAALPDGFEQQFGFTRLYAERDGAVWYAFKDAVPSTPDWSIRLNREAADALRQALGIQ